MNEPIELLLIGGGGHAAEVFSYVVDLQTAGQPIAVTGIIDDRIAPGAWETTQVLGGVDSLAALLADRVKPLHYITCIGNNGVRRRLVARLDALGPKLVPWTLRHPAAYVGRSVEIGHGTLLAPGAIVTTRTQIGRHCIVNARASVHHDCVIGDFANINPAATVCGAVRLGEEVYCGAGATVVNGKSVGADTIIGAGAVVTADLPGHVTAVGVPARTIKQHASQGS